MKDLKNNVIAFYKRILASIRLGLNEKKLTEEDIKNITDNSKIDDDSSQEEYNFEQTDGAIMKKNSDQTHNENTSLDDTEGQKRQFAELAGKSVALLNEEMIQDLINSLGQESIDSLFEDLFVKATEIHNTLIEASQDKDFDDVGERGHELKGMAANFGLDRLAALGDALEKVGMTRNEKRMFLLVDLYETILKDTKNELAQWRAAQKS